MKWKFGWDSQAIAAVGDARGSVHEEASRDRSMISVLHLTLKMRMTADFLSETRMRFLLILSSISAAFAAVTKYIFFNISEKVYSFGNGDSRVSFPLLQPIRHFLLLDPQNEAQVGLPSSTHYANGWFRFSHYTSMHYIIHNWLVSCCCRSHLIHASRCTVMHERFWNKW